MKLRTFAVTMLWLLSALGISGQALALAGSLPAFTELIERNSPAVVNISTVPKAGNSELGGQSRVPAMPEGGDLNDFLKKFLERHRDDKDAPAIPDDDEGPSSLGSGFVISSDGYVLTNHHVVKNAAEIVVRFSSRHEYKAELVGSDPRTDVALLKIDAKNLPVLKLGSSENLKVGEWVLAIGSPFGFEHSATAGIVRAKGRSLPSEQYVPFIQTDVAINPGNSGGPLFNLAGEVVGINSQIYSRTGGFMGLSFAIPIDVAMDVVEQLKTSGKVSRGWLGVYIQEITGELAESFGLKRPHGALVAQVIGNSPAEKGGIEVGDVILQFDGHPISHSSDLPPMVGRFRVGSKVEVDLLRDGKELKKTITIEALPEDEQIQARRRGVNQNRVAKLDIIVAPLSKEVSEALNVSQGVLVDEVMNGAAAEAGIREGDVIVSINNRKITGVEMLQKLVDELPAEHSVPVLIQRPGGPVFLPLKLPE
jgi:serine protease Do